MILLILAVFLGVVGGQKMRAKMLRVADDAINLEMFEGFDMIVRGITKPQLFDTLRDADLTADNLREANERGDAWAFRLAPPSSDHLYARKSPSGRRGPWTCYHGFEAFARAMFAAGMTSLNTVGPVGKRKTYRTLEAFEKDLDGFYYRQMGSMAFPVIFGELCAHEELS